ncbi:MAG TPA: hypothetical protein VGH84_16930, partial [Steroidobacteraceae bacterium]
MRPLWWVCIFLGVVTFSVSYQLFHQPSFPDRSPGAPDESEQYPLGRKSDRLPIHRDEARHDVGSADTDLKSDQRPVAQDEPRVEDASQDNARVEDAPGTDPVKHSSPNQTKQDLSYLAYYAYSELPPETKPADVVLNSLKDMPPGAPIEEIKRVADALGLDFIFMKAVAKIESGFNPKQRTGSYIGLFQLS